MSEFKSCPVCQEQSDQCLSCASYVVDGERIYYEKLKDFGATKDHEIRFINRIQKHRVTAFFHNGKLYIPSRQGRSVPLAIGLQWDAWQEQQAIIDDLRSQLNNMEACYIGKKKEVEELQGQLNKHSECIENLVNQKADYLDRVTKAIAHLDSFDFSQAGMNKLQRSIESALEALRGAND
ncbi:hypothetical protein [Acinetobacter schindleri]|uniref:hypothetical protein n=1 Tax=Acinetobacter schindleri TaxID=108981 RepID=UPI0028D6C9E4|nr:hypothetical protein [Acinetobacter schindleri]